MNRITWLASYPKSGNTWLRAFLSNLMSGRELQAASINALFSDGIASWLGLVSEYAGLDPADLTAEEIAALRPEIYRAMSAEASRDLHLKIHDARIDVAPGRSLIPADGTKAAVYVLRNPLDVAVSFAHHIGVSVQQSIDALGDPGYVLGKRPWANAQQCAQPLSSWSGHVESWLAAPFPVHVLRYEDMHREPLSRFTAVAEFLGLPADEARVTKAIRQSSFDELRTQEADQGFNERSPSSERFFRQGKAGGWRRVLSASQVEQVVRQHGPVMRRFSYLGPDGEPLG